MGVHEQVIAALSRQPGMIVTQVEALTTLPHSLVARVTLDSGETQIFKQAGNPDWAPAVRKEITINRDILSKIPLRVAPRLMNADSAGELPWLLLEDLSKTHVSPSLTPAPRRRDIDAFIA